MTSKPLLSLILREWKNTSVEVAERIVFNISQGRKIFKFLKFLEPVRKIHEELVLKRDRPALLKGLSIATLAFSFMLYGTDNMVWFANMGIIEPESRLAGIGGRTLPRVSWTTVKDIVALFKNIIEIVKYFFDALRNYKRQFYIMQLL